MRIISSFRDYYDTAMGYGVDYDTIWVREEQKVEKAPGLGSWSNVRRNRDEEFSYRTHTVGFCGKLYGCVEVWKPLKDGKKLSKICWKIEDIDEFVEANYKKRQVEYYYGKAERWSRWYSFWYLHSSRRAGFVRFWQLIEESHGKHEKFFIDNNTPVFVDKTINAKLKDLEFYRVFDPYTAFQEIQMFFGKLRSPERPIPPVSDADMLEAKGFDPKWSFRKEPGKKRKKRKK